MERIGELAAFGTAICWTASAIFFERASKRIGALAVNFYKVCAAFAFLAAAGFLLRGSPLPLDATPRAWAYLAVSGVVGFLVADYFLFNAYILVGSRLTVLFQPLTPSSPHSWATSSSGSACGARASSAWSSSRPASSS